MTIPCVFIFFLNIKHHKTDPTKISLRSFEPIFILLWISQNHEHTSITKHPLLASLYCLSSSICKTQSGSSAEGDFGEEDGANMGRQTKSSRAQWILVSGGSRSASSNGRASCCSGLGARARLVDERDAEAAVTPFAEGGFCKFVLHVYGSRRPVVPALRVTVCASLWSCRLRTRRNPCHQVAWQSRRSNFSSVPHEREDEEQINAGDAIGQTVY